ncbi:hypothetical protein EBZ39_15040 [bacterium]|nr:hypothetical protein [bacterium]
MIITELFNKLVAYVEALEGRDFRLHMAGFLGGLCVVTGLMVYSVQEKKRDLITKLQALNKQTIKAYHIIEDNRRMAKEELRLRQKLDQERDFTINGFFEQFCREQNLTPEIGWEARSEQVNDKFYEVLLSATFKDLTADRLVKALDELNKKDIVYVKECTIKTTNNRKINVGLTIATKRYKSAVE